MIGMIVKCSFALFVLKEGSPLEEKKVYYETGRVVEIEDENWKVQFNPKRVDTYNLIWLNSNQCNIIKENM